MRTAMRGGAVSKPEFAFDVALNGVIRVNAADKQQAEAAILAAFDACNIFELTELYASGAAMRLTEVSVETIVGEIEDA